jgi:hypothetical protein
MNRLQQLRVPALQIESFAACTQFGFTWRFAQAKKNIAR